MLEFELRVYNEKRLAWKKGDQRRVLELSEVGGLINRKTAKALMDGHT